MNKQRNVVLALNLISLVSVFSAANADSGGKFSGIGSRDAYNRSVDYLNEADKLTNTGKFEPAIQLYKKAIAIYPSDSKSHQNLAIALRKTGKLVESIIEDKKAIELEPNYLSAWLNMGLAYKLQQDYAEAERCYRKAVEIKPDGFYPLGNLGDILRMQGKFTEARKWLLRAKELPENKECPGEIDRVLQLCEKQSRRGLNEASK